jgi:hypothetical protein
MPRRGEDLGVAQVMSDEDGTKKEDIYYLIHKARNYMKFIVPQKFKADMYDTCTNKYERCAMWALDGMCDSEPEWMLRDCGPMCGSCHAHTIEDRCPVDPDAPNAWGPGDLNRLFMKLSSEPYLSKHDVQILSSPDTTGGPWIITMENVVSEEEASRFIELGSQMGFQRSSGKKDCETTIGTRH